MRCERCRVFACRAIVLIVLVSVGISICCCMQQRARARAFAAQANQASRSVAPGVAMSAPGPVPYGATAPPMAVAQPMAPAAGYMPMVVAQPMAAAQLPMASAVLVGDDKVGRLEQLKTMLDRGLITEKEYNEKKAEILATV